MSLIRRAKEFLKKQGVDQYTASVELNDRELQRLDITDGVFIAYGYQPVMITANCVKKNTEGCKKQEAVLHLTDRRGKKFAVKNYCKYCYNVIYNPIPLMLLHQAEEIRRLCPAEIRLDFVTESAKEMKKSQICMLRYFGWEASGNSGYRVYKRSF